MDNNTNGYRKLHTAPQAGLHTPLHALHRVYGVDVYTSPTRHGMSVTSSREAAAVALAVRDQPLGLVTVFRVVPDYVDSINAGDWVTTSETYAAIFAAGLYRAKPFRILSKTVTASEVYTKGNLLEEYGWNPDASHARAHNASN